MERDYEHGTLTDLETGVLYKFPYLYRIFSDSEFYKDTQKRCGRVGAYTWVRATMHVLHIRTAHSSFHPACNTGQAQEITINKSYILINAATKHMHLSLFCNANPKLLMRSPKKGKYKVVHEAYKDNSLMTQWSNAELANASVLNPAASLCATMRVVPIDICKYDEVLMIPQTTHSPEASFDLISTWNRIQISIQNTSQC